MDDSSMLCEYTLLTSGEIAKAGQVYVGWLAEPLNNWKSGEDVADRDASEGATSMCSVCRDFPKMPSATICGHVFCESYVTLLTGCTSPANHFIADIYPRHSR